MNTENLAYNGLRRALQTYAPISDSTWQAFRAICECQRYSKQTLLYAAGEIPTTFAYVYQGLVRCFVTDEKGNEYNKIFFSEDMFPGAMTALLTATPSLHTFETLEDSWIINIDFAGYRELMHANDEIKLFQIYYLEKNWLLAKDAREIEIVQEDATERYLRFVQAYPQLNERLPQYHIASHLGITPTQLSRIRKSL